MSNTFIQPAEFDLPTEFIYYCYGGQRWLLVPYALLENLDIHHDIDGVMSFRKEDTVYLHDSMDVTRFAKAFMLYVHRAKDYDFFPSICRNVYLEKFIFKSYPPYYTDRIW